MVDDSLICSFRLSNTAYAACLGKKVVMTEEVEVSKLEFSSLTKGGVMKIPAISNKRKRSTTNCTIQVGKYIRLSLTRTLRQCVEQEAQAAGVGHMEHPFPSITSTLMFCVLTVVKRVS